MKNRGDWFVTAGGRRVYVLDPEPSDICIEDIAHALSNICRYGGHALQFYSVAQHSVLVSEIARELSRVDCALCALLGLLHDAAEAYLGDVIRPLKAELARYKEIERLWESTVFSAFKLYGSACEMEIVKRADRIALVTERRDIGSPRWQEWGWKEEELGFDPRADRITPQSPEVARAGFLQRWALLTQEVGRGD